MSSESDQEAVPAFVTKEWRMESIVDRIIEDNGRTTYVVKFKANDGRETYRRLIFSSMPRPVQLIMELNNAEDILNRHIK